MGSAGAIRWGRAFVELFADDSSLSKTLKSGEKQVNEFGKNVSKGGQAIMSAGLAIAAPLAAAAKFTGSMGADMVAMSRKTGIGVETLSELSFAATQTGTSLEDLEHGLRHANKLMVEAASGSEEAQQTLDTLGLSVADLASLSEDQRFKLFADRLSRIHDPAIAGAFAMKVFGRGAGELMPLLQRGAGGIEELQQQARDLGVTMSADAAHDALAFQNQLATLWQVAKMGVFAVGSAVIPVMSEFTEKLIQVGGEVTQWIKANGGLISSVRQIGVIVAGAGAGLIALGKVISASSVGFTLLRGVVTAFLAPIKLVSLAFSGVVAALGGVFTAIGFLLSPIGLIVAAVGGLAVYFLMTTKKIGDAIGILGGWIGQALADFKTAWGAIVAAVQAGDLAAAGKVIWALLKLEFLRGTQFCQETWKGLVATIQQAFDVDLFYGLRAAWIDLMAFMSQAWVSLQRKMNTVAGGFRQTFAEQWINIVTQVWEGKSAQEAQERLKTFREDQARRGGSVVSNEELTKQSDEIEENRRKQLRENATAWTRAQAERAAKLGANEAGKRFATEGLDAVGSFLGAKRKATPKEKAEEELIRAQEELRQAVQQASQAQPKTTVKGRKPNDEIKLPNPVEFQGLERKFGVLGTFNKFAADRLFGSQQSAIPVWDQILAAIGKSNQILGSIDDNTAEAAGSLAFGP